MYGACCIDKDMVAKHMTRFLFLVQFNSFTWTTALYMLLATHSYVALHTILRVQQAQVFSRVSKATALKV